MAEDFEKQHKNILQSIDNLDCSENFTKLNFQLSEYNDSTGRKLPMYKMTRDGFTFLVMGTRQALRTLSKESGIPYATLDSWYYPRKKKGVKNCVPDSTNGNNKEKGEVAESGLCTNCHERPGQTWTDRKKLTG